MSIRSYRRRPARLNRSKFSHIAATLLAVSATFLAGATIMSPAANAYTYYSLGNGEALDINNAGQVVGYTWGWDPISSSYQFFPAYTSSYASGLSAITGLSAAGGQGIARSISQVPSGGTTGYITGFGYTGKGVITAAAWASASSTPIALSTGGAGAATTFGVNSSFSIAGNLTSPYDQAGLWTYSSLTSSFSVGNLGPAASTSYGTWAYAINDAGIAVGQCYDATTMGTTAGVPAIFSGGSSVTLIPIGTYTVGTAYDVSNGSSYYVVGTAGPTSFPPGTTPYTHAFLWSSATNTFTDLGTLPGEVSSYALGVNDNGDAVGYSEDVVGKKTAVIWVGGGSPTVLLGGSSTSNDFVATSINNSGDIVGYEENTSVSGKGAWYLKY